MSAFEIRVFERKSKKSARTLGSRGGSTPPASDRPIESSIATGLVRARVFNWDADHPPTPLISDVSGHVGGAI